MHTSPRAFGLLACAGAAALWGTGFFFGKIALREMPVGDMVLYRFVFATLTVLPLLPRIPSRFSRRDWGLLLLGTFLGIPLQFLLQFSGLARTTLAHAALMVGTMPVILALGSQLFFRERLDRVGWIALSISATGAVLIAASHGSSSDGVASIAGDGLVIASVAVSFGWVALNKVLMRRHSSLAVSLYGLLSGTAMLAAIDVASGSLPRVHGVSRTAWLALAASGVFCTAVTTLLWNWGLTQVPAPEAGVFLNFEPVIGSALAVIVFHERMGWTGWVGGAAIVASAFVMTTWSRTTAPATSNALVTE